MQIVCVACKKKAIFHCIQEEIVCINNFQFHTNKYLPHSTHAHMASRTFAVYRGIEYRLLVLEIFCASLSLCVRLLHDQLHQMQELIGKKVMNEIRKVARRFTFTFDDNERINLFSMTRWAEKDRSPFCICLHPSIDWFHSFLCVCTSQLLWYFIKCETAHIPNTFVLIVYSQ